MVIRMRLDLMIRMVREKRRQEKDLNKKQKSKKTNKENKKETVDPKGSEKSTEEGWKQENVEEVAQRRQKATHFKTNDGKMSITEDTDIKASKSGKNNRQTQGRQLFRKCIFFCRRRL